MTTMSVIIMKNAGLPATAEKLQKVSQNSEGLSNFAITESVANWNIMCIAESKINSTQNQP